MVEVPRAALRDALNDDAEFRHAARYWDASLRLGIGGESLCVRIEDGRVADVRPSASGDPVSVAIDGPVAEWEKLLAPVPRPFYQSVYAAAIHHGIQFSGDPVDMYAYLGAVTRLVDVLREQVEIQ